MADFPQNLKEVRKKKGLTQKELAALLNVSQNAIFNWENGKREPSLEMIERISTALGIQVAQLLGYSENIYALYKAYSESDKMPTKIVETKDEMLVIGGTLISESNLLKEYRMLNHTGKKEAIDRISELKYVPGYTGDDDWPIN